MVKRFYEFFANRSGKSHIDVSLFMEAVLDPTFKELKIHNTGQPAPCPELIPTIVKWCPLLEKLSICHNRKDESPANKVHDEAAHKLQVWVDTANMVHFESTFLSLRSLQHLTHLSLLEMNADVRAGVLPVIGKACPSLSELCLDGDHLFQSTIFRLILGAYSNDLFPMR